MSTFKENVATKYFLSKVTNNRVNSDNDMAWINAQDIFDMNKQIVSVITEQRSSHDKEKSRMTLELIQNYRAHVLSTSKHNQTPTYFEPLGGQRLPGENSFNFDNLSDTKKEYGSRNIRLKQRPSSAPQRRKRMSPQRPHSAKPQRPAGRRNLTFQKR